MVTWRKGKPCKLKSQIYSGPAQAGYSDSLNSARKCGNRRGLADRGCEQLQSQINGRTPSNRGQNPAYSGVASLLSFKPQATSRKLNM